MGESKTRLWALTGSIASGKSEVERILKEHGAHIVDADAISRELTTDSHPFLKKLEEVLGTGILNAEGTGLDRQKCRTLISQDPNFKKTLEKTLHPEIAKESWKRIDKLLELANTKVFYSAALLIEAGRAPDFPKLLLITADDSIREQRLVQRDGMTSEKAKELMKIQMLQDEKRKHATVEIENNGTIDELEEKVKGFYQKLD